MTKNISEELPARKFPQASVDGKGAEEKGGQSAEKKIRQAVYDIRYRARREDIDIRQAFSQYIQNSSLGQNERIAVRLKLFGKGGIKEAYTSGVDKIVSNSISNAFVKVFVEKNNNDQTLESIENEIIEEYESILNKSKERKYKVRVADKNSGKSYVRYATRSKISQLRANPYLEVEMTEYGEPYEGERKKGEQTAAALGGGAKKDRDGDGKVESDSKEHAGLVHNAIQRKKGGVPDGKDTSRVRNEEFIGEVKKEKAKKDTVLDILKKGTNNIKVFPPDTSSPTTGNHHHYSGTIKSHYEFSGHLIGEKAESEQQQKLFGLALSVKRGKTPRSEASAEVLKIVDTMSEKKIRDFAKTKHEGLPVHKEEIECGTDTKKKDKKELDPRSIPTTTNLIKNKFRAMGVRNPIVMVATEEAGDGYIGPARLGIKNPLASDATRAASDKKRVAAAVAGKKPTEGGLLGRLQQNADAIDAAQKMYNHYELDGKVISEREHDEPGETGPEVERHNAALRRNQPPETIQQRIARKAAEQRASGKAGRNRRRY
jgi:hypothetical protein